eukprot:3242072-Amphidinium_carterae.2
MSVPTETSQWVCSSTLSKACSSASYTVAELPRVFPECPPPQRAVSSRIPCASNNLIARRPKQQVWRSASGDSQSHQ